MRRTFKYRLYPSKGQLRLLNRSLNECRWVYNETLATRKAAWDFLQKNVSLFDCNALLPTWKKARPSLKGAFSQCLQDAQKRVDLAFQAFFRRVKAGEKPGYPRFRGRDRYDSIAYPQYENGCRLEKNILVLSKIGSVPVVLHRPVEGEIKTATLTRSTTGKWFACFSCDNVQADTQSEAIEGSVGIDLGLQHFAYLSNGEHIKNPRFFKKGQDALARAQRRLEKADKGTERRERRKRAVAHLHEKIVNRRRDFAHKLSRKLVNRFQNIFFEDLNIRGMLEERKHSKSIGDAAWNQLVQFTTYKAEDAGRRVGLVDPRGTSQRCCRCGTVVRKDISVRVHACTNPGCGFVAPRDHNSALEIERLGLQSLDGVEAIRCPPRSHAALAAVE